LAGSVLPSGFRWDVLRDEGVVGRVVNECGLDDRVVTALSGLPGPVGQAGRVGFSGLGDPRFRNRYHRIGHNGFFSDRRGAPSDDFMRRYWLPLLTTNEPVEPV